MNIAILGAGRIAHTMAKTLVRMADAKCYAIASRDIEKARKFAEEYHIPKAYGSYEEMVQDPAIELVYIATPHSHHAEHMKLCIEHGKPILCEKAFTMNAKEAREIAEMAREKKVYVAEAIWTRYMPSRKIIDELLASGIIGKVTSMTSNLFYPVQDKPRIMDPLLCGGALLDVGIYPITFTDMHFGDDIERIVSSCVMTETGVDGMNSITYYYKDGRMAQITSGIYARSDRKGIFYGDKGYMVVENINNPRCIDIFDTQDQLIRHVEVPKQISGYEYEVREAMNCIRAGRFESVSAPLDESIRIMECMDSLRAEWGLVYPMEK